MTNHYTNKIFVSRSSFRRWLTTVSLMLSMFLLNQSVSYAQALCGTVTVGSGGTYGSISAAFTALNTNGISCSVVVELLPTYTSALEPGSPNFTINTGITAGVGAGATITVRPQAGSGVLTITSSSVTGTVVENTSQYVIFDGRPGGVGTSRNLIIANSATGSVGTVILQNDASHNTFQYCALQGVSTALTSGVVNIGTTTLTTGNDFNLFDNCNIGDGVSTPTNGIVALGTAAKDNDNNTISNCNIFNYYNSTSISKGISVGQSNGAWTISGNRFYQTASRAYPAGVHSAITVVATGAPAINFTISNNIIGFASNTGTGNYIMNSTFATRFNGITLQGITAGSNTISGNQISNIVLTTTDVTNTTSPNTGTFNGILSSGGTANITGNTIGSSTGVDNIVINVTTGTTSVSAGIIASSVNPALATISANNIGAISVLSSTNTIGGSLRGIVTLGNGFRNASLNNIGSTSTANSMRAATAVGGAVSCSVIGMDLTGTNVNNILNNTVANLFANGTGTVGQAVGIQTSGGTNTITGNTVRNLTNANPNAASSGGTGAVIGINYIAATSTAPQNISQNTIYSLSSTAATAAVTVTGLNFQGASGSGHIVGRNLIHSLSAATSATALIIGINNNAGSGVTFQNNMIRLGTSISAPYTIIGLNKTSLAVGSSYLHNSVYIGGSVGSGSALTSVFRRSVQQSSGTDDLKNNIFWNARFNTAGTGVHYALNFIAGGASFTSDKNVLLVDTVQGGQTGAITATNYLNIASWKAGSLQDASSFAADPKFINPTGLLTAVDLHIQPSPVATVIESAGTSLATVSDDFDGQTRASFTPVDIGADAGDFTSLGDFVGPVFGSITSSPGSSCTAVSHTITANITDASGVASATFNYSINNVAQAPIAMTNIGGNNWQVVLTANGNALVLYSITAIDATPSANSTISAFNSYQDNYLSGGLSAGPDVSICLNDSTTLSVFRTIGKVLFTEITGAHSGTGLGTVAPGIGGDDFIELTNLGSIPVDISGWKLEITGASPGAINIPVGNVIGSGKTFVISRGAGGTANIPGVYLDGAALSGVGPTSAQGYILSNTFGQIVDVAAINGFNVVGTGSPLVLATDWSGIAVNQSAAAGIRRTVGTDNNAASDWTPSSAINLTNFGTINGGLTVDVSPSITWTPGGSNLSSIRVSPASTTTYTATISDGVCSAADQVIVNILPLPANLTVNNGLHCGNKVPVASINAAAGAVLYNWYTAPTGGTLLQSSSSLTYLTPINTTTTFYVNQFNGSCTSLNRVAITETVTNPPVVAAQANDSTVCANSVITLTALSANPSYVYTWSAVNGNLQATTGTTVTAQPLNAGTINYIVSALDPANGCDYIDTVVVIVSANPPLTLTVSNTNICQYGFTNLTANIISGSAYCVPTFAFAGNSGDFVDNFTFNTITNNASGDGDFTFYNNLSTTVIPGNTYPISMQAGAAFAQGFRVWIDYNRNGSFADAGEDVFNSGVSGSTVFSGTVTIPANAVSGPTRIRVMCKFAGVPLTTEVCANTGFGEAEDYVVNINTAVSSSYSILWSPASGLSSTTAPSVTYTATNPGSFPKTVVATDVVSGCTSSASTTIVVADAPEAPTCSGGTICGQGNVTLNATPAPGGNSANLFWTAGLGGKVLGTGPSLTQFVVNSGSAIVREKPATAVTSNIGFVGDLTAAAGFFPTTTQGLWFKVNSGNGVLINTVDIYPNGPIGSILTIAIQDTNGVTIGTVSTVTTVTNVSTAPTLNKQTVNIGIFVPYSPNAYRMRPTQNPNLAAHNVGVTGAPWQIAGQIQILGYGDMGPAPAPSIFANTLYGFFYNWNVTTGCFGDICSAAYTVTAPANLTITPSGSTSYCGTGSVGLTAGGSPTWTNFTWSPAAGLSSTTGATVTATPTVTTTYIVLATDGLPNGCADTAQITITVNTAPFVTAGAAPADTICNQTSFQFNAQGGSPSFKTLGLTQNPGQATGAIFNGANLNQRSQALITAAELNAIGLVGPTVINSVGFFVNNKLSNQPYSNFTVKMASDPDVCWTSTTHSVAAATTCYAGNYSTVAGWNDIIFTTPYVWDGVSSIVLETCFSNSTTSFFDLVYTSTTPACNKFRSDNAAACSATTGTIGTERPNMRFTGGQVTFSWSPATNLSATNIRNPLFTPTTTGPKSYTVTVTDPSSGCTASSTLNFVVSTKPKVTSAFFQANNNEICVSGTKMMIANVFDGSLQWQQSSNGVNFTDIPGANNDTLITGTVTLDTYYRLKSFCTDSSFSNIIFLDVKNPSLVSTTPGTRCGQGIVNLSATAAAGYYTQWFADSTSSTPLSNANNYSPFITVTDTFWVAASVDTISAFNGGPAPSYCAISNQGSSCITNVTFGTMNFSGPLCTAPLFWDVIPEASATVAVVPGQTLPFTLTCDGAAIASVWIDFNRNGTYEPTEWQQVFTNAATGTISITIPANAASGKTGMRVRSRLTGNANGAGDGCLAMGSGSSQDFTISIGAPSCSSARVPVIATSTPATAISVTPATVNLCGGGASATLTISSGAGAYNGFSWSPGTGLNTTTGTTVIANPTSNTNYIVTATNSINGCATTATVIVTVTPPPVINSIVASPNPLCFGDSAQIVVTASPFIAPSGAMVFTPSSGTYNPLVGGTNVADIQTDDAASVALPIGFSFNFGGTAYTQFFASSNGYLTFGSANASLTNDLTTGAGKPIIAPLWDDLQGANGVASYLTTGAPGSRVLTFEWLNWRWYYTVATPTISFQVKLYEANGKIEYIYRQESTPLGGVSESASIGLNGIAAGTLVSLNNTSASPVASGVETTTLNTKPATGQVYTFTPPVGTSLTYGWSPSAGLNNPAISNPKASPAGNTNYTVIVTEVATGCTASASILIQKSLLPTPKITPGNTTLCFPDVIYLHVVDTLNYPGGYPAGTTIDWVGIVSGLSPTDSISSANGNIYQVQVNLPNGCNALSPIRTITTRSVTVVPVITPATCGANNGAITANITNGNPPFNYVWTDGVNTIRNITTSSTSDAISNLAPGTYYLSVFDNIGNAGTLSCNSGSIPFVVSAPPPIVVNITKTNISCNGNGDGSATASSTGGSGTKTYLWSTGSTQSVIGGLSAGTYTVTVTDAFGCTGTNSVSITEPALITVLLSQTPATCNGGLDGTATAVVGGGTAPIQIDWYEGINFVIVGTGPTLTGVPAGLYFAVVTDVNGCQQFDQITILEPAPIVVSSFTPTSGGIGTLVTISGSGFVNVTGVKFNGVSTTFTVINSGQINANVPAGATTGTISVITNNICTGVSSGSFTVISTAALNVKAFIEGYYAGGGTLTAVLLNQGIAAGANECDSVTVELRDQFSPGTLAYSSTKVLGTNGMVSLTVPGALIGNSYYIAVFHRNALQTWSFQPVTISGTTTYDFTTANNKSFGSNQTQVEPGVWAFYSGDIAPQDEFIDVFDQSTIDNDAGVFAFGYFATDVNGDGFVDVFDQAVVDNNAAFFLFSAHP